MLFCFGLLGWPTTILAHLNDLQVQILIILLTEVSDRLLQVDVRGLHSFLWIATILRRIIDSFGTCWSIPELSWIYVHRLGYQLRFLGRRRTTGKSIEVMLRRAGFSFISIGVDALYRVVILDWHVSTRSVGLSLNWQWGPHGDGSAQMLIDLSRRGMLLMDNTEVALFLWFS